MEYQRKVWDVGVAMTRILIAQCETQFRFDCLLGGSARVVSESAEQAQKTLRKPKRSVECLHGKMTQAARDQALLNFRSGKKSILVATGMGTLILFLVTCWAPSM